MRRELLHQRPVPLLADVELELELRIQLEVRLDLRSCRRDEAHAAGTARPTASANDVPACRSARSSDRALEGPAAVVARSLVGGIAAPERQPVEVAREIVERPRAGEHQVGREVVVIGRGVRDVLAVARLAVALERDRRRHARPAARQRRAPAARRRSGRRERGARRAIPRAAYWRAYEPRRRLRSSHRPLALGAGRRQRCRSPARSSPAARSQVSASASTAAGVRAVLGHRYGVCQGCTRDDVVLQLPPLRPARARRRVHEWARIRRLHVVAAAGLADAGRPAARRRAGAGDRSRRER